MGVNRESGDAGTSDERVDWPALFLEHSVGDVFEYGRRLRAAGPRDPEELAELFAERRALREEAARLIAAFAQTIERGNATEIACFFREGAWTRFADITGFEAALAEMVQPHLSTLDEKGFNVLEDAVARALRECAGDERVDGARIAPALAAVFERERNMRSAVHERKLGPWKRAVLLILVIVFILVRAYFRMAR